MTEQMDWHEDPERPGVFVPDAPVELCSGDSFSITHTLVGPSDASSWADFTALPWAEGTIERDEA